MRRLVLVAHNIRSAHNVGSLFRTAEGLGVEKLILTGYSPYPPTKADERPPHMAAKVGRQIQKTALGAENSLAWEHFENIEACMGPLEKDGFLIVALEQTTKAQDLASFQPHGSVALVVGNEVDGLEPELLEKIDYHVRIPMAGHKESFNVAVAAAMALYQLANT